MNARFLSIKQAAELLGVTPLTLRNWDKRGVLVAYRHPVNNYRLYRYADIENLLLELEQSRGREKIDSPPVQKLTVRFEDDAAEDANSGDSSRAGDIDSPPPSDQTSLA